MPAYLIANITVRDPKGFAEYRARVPAVIAAHGGRYVIRGGAVDVKEGDPGLDRLIVLEFPDMAGARAFYDDPEYAPLLALRLASTEGSLVLVEGYAG